MIHTYYFQYIPSVVPRVFEIIRIIITSTFVDLHIQTNIHGLQNMAEINKQEDLGRIGEDVSNNSSIVACVFIATVTFLQSNNMKRDTHTDTQTDGRDL
jgi:hypothetical protein